MQLSYQTPGVYREDRVLRAPPRLATGVPGFAGFARAADGSGLVMLDDAVQIAVKLDFSLTPSWLPKVLQSFFDNGGDHCYVACANPAATNRSDALIAAIAALAALDDLDLLAVPDAMQLRGFDGQVDKATALLVQQEAIRQSCVHDKLALLDSFPGASVEVVSGTAADASSGQRYQLGLGMAEPINAALYYPWPLDAGNTAFPPCGVVAGVIATTDAEVGVFKAPANRPLAGVLDLEAQIDEVLQGPLNLQGINCLRAFPGRGIRIWGARTLSRDPAWQQISVRRLFTTLSRWLDANMDWVTFEPNTPSLWASVRRRIESWLERQWRAGAMAGATASDAYYVRCNADTNPSATRDNGWLVTEIGLAPTLPAEFVVVRVSLRLDSSGAG